MAWRAAAYGVLTTAGAEAKAQAALLASTARGKDAGCNTFPSARPARPTAPALVAPRDVPRRRLGTAAGRTGLLHALAHIELNAVDLAFDMALRFAGEIDRAGLDSGAFVADWVGVGHEEASHFLMLNARLQALGSHYGALPAHDGLWEAAEATGDSALARLAIAPMVLEARGLDVTPGMAARLRAAGDKESAAILDRIFADEIGHVAIGVRWFTRLCAARGLEPGAAFEGLVADRFRGGLKPPFNEAARNEAGLAPAFYARWNNPCASSPPGLPDC
ncbi:MAG: ferritin-like domain-containing protein [Parvularculaceae bacterium]